MKILRGITLLLLILSGFLALPTGTARAAATSSADPCVLVVEATGPLTPAMLQYLSRGIRAAEDRGCGLLVLQLNTPGGEIELLNRMVSAVRASHVPVVVYIAPRGAIAGSAGTVLTLAGHLAAMAPETAIGAASPVGSQGEDIGETMQAKTKEILKATARSLAERRTPEAIALAEETIESARAVTSTEALAAGLVDYVASDIPDLLRQLDGREVTTIDGTVTLHTADAVPVAIPPTFVEQLLGMLTNPNIVLLLLSVGVQALLIELSSPGGWVAGFIGVICLALATYGLGILPVNWFGLVFILMAFVLFIVDIKAPTHGALTAAGVGSFIAGGLILFNSPSIPSFQRVSVPLVVGTGLVTAATFGAILGFAIRAQRKPILTGRESLVGREGVVKKRLDPTGSVQLSAELWTAESASGATIPIGVTVRVVEVRGLKLMVERK
jgi:membrane-bound serine protease (ClpP class)